MKESVYTAHHFRPNEYAFSNGAMNIFFSKMLFEILMIYLIFLLVKVGQEGISTTRYGSK